MAQQQLDPPSVRQMRRAEMDILLDWAAAEGWNPGLDDAEAFYRADPDGFFVATLNDNPAAFVAVVRHSRDQAFLGLYICSPECRGKGLGLAAWKAGMNHVGSGTIGLDGVVEQQDNYRKSGFELAYRNLRYAGKPSFEIAASRSRHQIRAVEDADIPVLLGMDMAIQGFGRHHFMDYWLTNRRDRHTVLMESNDAISGFATIRACREHHKIGPVIARNTSVAESMIHSLVEEASAKDIVLDVPTINQAAVELATKLKLAPVFETARMYCGKPPNAQLDQIFGVTTFELG